MKRLLALAASSTIVLSLVSTGVLDSTTVVASGSVTCQNLPISPTVTVECVGQVNGTGLVIDIGEIPPLTEVQLVYLETQIDNFLNSSPIVLTPQAIANQVVLILERMGFHTCVVRVVEQGIVGSGLASCH